MDTIDKMISSLVVLGIAIGMFAGAGFLIGCLLSHVNLMEGSIVECGKALSLFMTIPGAIIGLGGCAFWGESIL